MTNHSHGSHVGTSLSIVDLLTVLYTEVLRVKPDMPEWPDRDRFILSKGHGCAALYATLAEMGFFPLDWLTTYSDNGSKLAGHITHYGVPGVEVSTGSLGHGLSIGCGMALAAKRDRKTYRVFVLLGDGECDEGSIWEAALFAAQQKLDNLVVIVDHNKIQAMGNVKEVLDLEPFADKWKCFNWSVRQIDGHDYKKIKDALKGIPCNPEKPSCIVANTVKGKGVSFMENQLAWHYKSPNDEELKCALAELQVPE